MSDDFEVAYGNLQVERDDAQHRALRAERALAEALAREATLRAVADRAVRGMIHYYRTAGTWRTQEEHSPDCVKCRLEDALDQSSPTAALLLAVVRAADEQRTRVANGKPFTTKSFIEAVDALRADPAGQMILAHKD